MLEKHIKHNVDANDIYDLFIFTDSMLQRKFLGILECLQRFYIFLDMYILYHSTTIHRQDVWI